jgi:hypothetical protein
VKRGRKAEPPSVKEARGTLQPCRDDNRVEVFDQHGLPSKPDWLTAAGEEVWIDEVGRVAVGRFVSERDTTMFANYCNLQGAISLAWKAGGVPPAAHLMEARKMAEQFGLFGAKSRIGTKGNGEASSGNPFTANGRRPG